MMILLQVFYYLVMKFQNPNIMNFDSLKLSLCTQMVLLMQINLYGDSFVFYNKSIDGYIRNSKCFSLR